MFKNVDSLNKYLVKFNEEHLADFKGKASEVNLYDADGNEIAGYIGVKNEQFGSIVNCTKDSYKVVSNEIVTNTALESFNHLGADFKIDTNHSVVTPDYMRISLVTDTKIIQDDDGGDIYNTIDIYNSYNKSRAIGIHFGTIRQVCTNGYVGKVGQGQVRLMHTRSFTTEKIYAAISKLDSMADKYRKFFEKLQRNPWMLNYEDSEKWMKKYVGANATKSIMVHLGADMPKSQYDMLNALTWYASHEVDIARRVDMQTKIAAIPELQLN